MLNMLLTTDGILLVVAGFLMFIYDSLQEHRAADWIAGLCVIFDSLLIMLLVVTAIVWIWN